MKTQESPTSQTIRGIISDLDGVAYRGDTAIPSSVKAFRAWHEQGMPYAFVTNNSTKSAAQFAAKLTGIGIPAEPRQVFNTISAATALLARRWPQGTPVFAIGEQPLLEAIEAAGYDLLPIFVMLRRMLLTAWIASHSDTETARRLGTDYTDATVAMGERFLQAL